MFLKILAIVGLVIAGGQVFTHSYESDADKYSKGTNFLGAIALTSWYVWALYYFDVFGG